MHNTMHTDGKQHACMISTVGRHRNSSVVEWVYLCLSVCVRAITFKLSLLPDCHFGTVCQHTYIREADWSQAVLQLCRHTIWPQRTQEETGKGQLGISNSFTATTAKIWTTEADQLPVHQPTSTSISTSKWGLAQSPSCASDRLWTTLSTHVH